MRSSPDLDLLLHAAGELAGLGPTDDGDDLAPAAADGADLESRAPAAATAEGAAAMGGASAPVATPAADALLGALGRAVHAANELAMDHDAFMQAAWLALLEARPGLRAELEHRALRQQIDGLRAAGRLATA